MATKITAFTEDAILTPLQFRLYYNQQVLACRTAIMNGDKFDDTIVVQMMFIFNLGGLLRLFVS
jgi:hypothetical protein